MKTKLIVSTVAALALGIGIYAILAPSGNRSNETGAKIQTSQAEAADCSLSVERGKLLDAAANGDVAAFRGIDEPLDMSGISFKDADGKQMSLADWKGRMVLFNLWATWCPPCREEMPYFEELQTRKGSEKFAVVPVSIDTNGDEKPKAFYKETGLKALPFFQDASMDAFQQLRKKGVALGMPTTLMVDTNGCALGVLNGPAHWASIDAIKLVDAALALEASQ